jgi:peptidoglycan/LPS O-acetylase OafA/YrhL
MPIKRCSFNESLNAFRGLAALLVALGHLEQVFLRPYSQVISPFAGLLAQASVMIFFVISGYSITASIEGLIGKPNSCYEYFIRRFCRVMPPLVTVLLLMYLLHNLAPYFFSTRTRDFISQSNLIRGGFYFDIGEATGSLLFLNGFLTATPDANGPLWSLSFEVWLYGIFFAVYYAFTNNIKIPILIAVNFYLLLIFIDNSGNWLFFKYSLIWFLGASSKIIMSTNDIPLMSYTGYTKVFFILSLMVTLFIGYRYVQSGMKLDISSFNICVGICFWSYLLTNHNQHLIKKTIISECLIKASDFSYTLYLIHFPLYLFIFGITQAISVSNVVSLCIVYLLIVLIAYLLSKFTENRALFLTLMRARR